MAIHPSAGQPAPESALVDLHRLLSAYESQRPDPSIPGQRVSFGTSGHRGTSTETSFNEAHIVAITQAICEYRHAQGIDGPLFLGMDTHALSRAAFETALGVLSANGVTTMIDARDGFTPTPVISHAILNYNRCRSTGLADGIVITPSHNPPEDGGFKYNATNGGPADARTTGWIQRRANELLASVSKVKRLPCWRALIASTTHKHDYIGAYVDDLASVIDFAAIRGASVTLGVDPLGGAGMHYWGEIAHRHEIPLTVVSDVVDPTFRFMTLDWDGKIRMDCSSAHAMRPLIEMKDEFDVAWACDPDHDRHGIVARSTGLLNPNHYLAVAIEYLFTHRAQWPRGVGIGKTVVSSSMIDRVAERVNAPLVEVPVGFKWFVDGFISGTLGFGGEESAGASFLRKDGGVWSTDKDGIIMGLLAAEMTAVTGRDPGELYAALTSQAGNPVYERIDAAATPEQKAALGKLSPDQVPSRTLAGDPIEQMLTKAPNSDNAIGGLKVSTKNGWFAARPSGTEAVYKLYAESWVGQEHLRTIQREAQEILGSVLAP